MKKLLIIAVAIASVYFTVNSCKKTGGNINPLTSVSNLGIGSYLVLDSNINLNFNLTQIATSTVGIIVHGYPGGEAVDHVILYATLGSTWDTTQWHQVTSIPYTGKGTKLTVTGAQLGTAMGVDPTTFAPGTFYTFYTRVVTKSGKTYDVNNTGTNSGSGINGGTYYYAAMSFAAYVTCPFTGGMAGTYKVIQDGWGDWNAGDLVQVTDGPGPNQINLSQVYPNPKYGSVINPLLVNVDPATGAATVPKVDFGNYGYTATVTSGSGYVFSCVGYITLSNDIFAGPYGDQGVLNLILQKQ
ncbi:MAG: hypothetical protein JST58_15230 [Bacteroidetes bacterium]|nr:hypothetical protein [Bacteroidota bacterium]